MILLDQILRSFYFFPLFIFRSKDHKCQREKYENKGFKSNDLVSNRGNHVVVFFIRFSGLLLVSISKATESDVTRLVLTSLESKSNSLRTNFYPVFYASLLMCGPTRARKFGFRTFPAKVLSNLSHWRRNRKRRPCTSAED